MNGFHPLLYKICDMKHAVIINIIDAIHTRLINKKLPNSCNKDGPATYLCLFLNEKFLFSNSIGFQAIVDVFIIPKKTEFSSYFETNFIFNNKKLNIFFNE